MTDRFVSSFVILLLLATCADAQYTVMTKHNGSGDYLIDGINKTALYYFKNDGGNEISECYGKCLIDWIPFSIPDLFNVSSNLKESDFSYIIRQDGKIQAAYLGWPLYRFRGDKYNTNDTKGDGKDRLWYLIYINRFPPMINFVEDQNQQFVQSKQSVQV
jgi:predicted lipoprotein with Yx(FWY)xxD motif